jgi:sigma-B regulation protein RsbU (phosphoserine phosphatase)
MRSKSARGAVAAEPDLEENRLAQLTDMLRDISSDSDPIRSINRYVAGMRNLFGNQGMVSISCRGLAPGHYRVMRFLHEPGTQQQGYTNLTFGGPEAPIHTGGFFGEILSKGRPVVLRNAQIESDLAFGSQLAPYRLIVATPVYDEGVATNWVLFLSTDASRFSIYDIETRILEANLWGGIANSKRATKELREANALIQREIDEIADIQRGLLPRRLPVIPGVELAITYHTYDRAGGDFYDFFPIPGGDADSDGWGILIADASGHGPSAAVVVAMLSALLRSYPHGRSKPGEVLSFLNRHLSATTINGSFITAFLGYFEPRSLALRYASAGHPAPLLREGNGQVRAIDATDGVPLCVLPEVNYSGREIQLRPGQALLLYTDGVTEARSRGGEQFGEHRLAAGFSDGVIGADTILEHVLERLRAHEQGRRPSDDQTLIVFQLRA